MSSSSTYHDRYSIGEMMAIIEGFDKDQVNPATKKKYAPLAEFCSTFQFVDPDAPDTTKMFGSGRGGGRGGAGRISRNAISDQILGNLRISDQNSNLAGGGVCGRKVEEEWSEKTKRGIGIERGGGRGGMWRGGGGGGGGGRGRGGGNGGGGRGVPLRVAESRGHLPHQQQPTPPPPTKPNAADLASMSVETLSRRMKGLMNKLSTNNYDRIKPQMFEIHDAMMATTKEDDSFAVEFTKLLDSCIPTNSKYIDMYAKLVMHLTENQGSPGSALSIRRQVLSQCQAKFQDIPNSIDSENNEQEMMNRKKWLHQMTFVSQLFIYSTKAPNKLVTENLLMKIMGYLIQKLDTRSSYQVDCMIEGYLHIMDSIRQHVSSERMQEMINSIRTVLKNHEDLKRHSMMLVNFVEKYREG